MQDISKCQGKKQLKKLCRTLTAHRKGRCNSKHRYDQALIPKQQNRIGKK
ncbi:hypothetical protein J31TS6_29330 [Brevibacillus reuszeri]|nr:hypothetical protein J31TS6_29330 [Brevibacillus reuszeri]